MNKALFHDFLPQIRRLLHRDHEPAVTKSISKILENAGIGVFTTRTILPGEALCLYPGVYCPGIPTSMLHGVANQSYDEEIEFVGHNSTPSGIPIEENAYILNIQTAAGGYIDGMALEVIEGRHVPVKEYLLSHKLYHVQAKSRLDSNPSFCGHVVNHSKRQQNVQILPFLWSYVGIPTCSNHKSKHKLEKAYTSEAFSLLPNLMRQDGAPRYLFNGGLIHYATFEDKISPIDKLCGAVIYATKHIGPDQELFLDYKLKPPLPLWAKSWYDSAE